MVQFTNEHLAGYIPDFLSVHDPRPAVEQLNENYAHGGGWHPFKGFMLVKLSREQYGLAYPDDPPMREMSRGVLRDETIVLFESSWVAVIQKDGSYEVARMD